MAITLADIYQSANISLVPETFAARQAAVTAISDALTDEQSLTLTRFYYGLPVNEEAREWLRTEMAKSDGMFSLVQREREVAVIAEAILWAAASASDEFAATAVVSAAANHTRRPLVNAVQLSSFEAALKNMARQRRAALTFKFKPMAPSIVTGPDFSAVASLPAAGELYSKANEDLRKGVQAALTETQTAVLKLVEAVKEGQEQGDIMSWLIGGWSRRLGRPFNALSPSVAAVAAGIDLADLTTKVAGPYAAEALLHRVLQQIKPPKGGKVSFLTLGDSVTAEEVSAFTIPNTSSGVADLCPVFTAMSQSAERGPGNWSFGFQKATGIDAKTEFDYGGLALQAMR